MQTPAIEIKSLVKSYSNKASKQVIDVLRSIDLTIPKGSCFGLLGPNGAGKSTLINILGGITLKNSGSVSICGHDIVSNPRQAKMSIGIVPQEVSIDPFFTIRETLENYAGYYGISKSQRKTTAIIDILGLQDKADAFPRSLSGGMKRRLLIAKALVHSPQVLVLDEPTAGVDIALREQLWQYVKILNESGTTIVLTTHYLEEAEQLCDHIAIINNGEIIANDRTENLLHLIDRKQLVIDFTHPLQEVPEYLNHFDSELTETGNLIIHYKVNDSSINEIIQAIANTGLQVKDISSREIRLDDVFKRLVIT